MFYNLVAVSKEGAMGLFSTFVMVVPLIIIGMIVWDMRQKKKSIKKQKDMIDNLKEGDRVVTIGGLVGEIASVSGEDVEIKVDKGTRLQFRKRAIASVLK